MIGTRSEQNYSYKTDFNIWRGNQDFGRQNISMSRPPLDSTHIGINTTNETTSPIDSIPVETKMPEPMPLKRPMESSIQSTESSTRPTYYAKQKVKAHVPEDPESDPSSSDSPPSEDYSSNDSNCIKFRINN